MRTVFVAMLVLAGAGFASAQEEEDRIPYGDNPDHAATAAVNGIDIYYEEYGDGEPLILLHGNSQALWTMRHQIEFFADHYRIIAPDSRGQGKSGRGEGKLTYELMADDMIALMDHLELDSAHVLGWSDGGIVGLLMACRAPDRVDRLAVSGANLTADAAHDWALEWGAAMEEIIEAKIAAADTTRNWAHHQEMFDLLLRQPHITEADLARITAPVLVAAGDRDIIRTEHTVMMFESLPRAQLAIFPGTTHDLPFEDAEVFNPVVLRFLQEPFVMPDSRAAFE